MEFAQSFLIPNLIMVSGSATSTVVLPKRKQLLLNLSIDFFFENGQRHFQPQQLEAINPTFYPPKRLLVYRNLNPRHLFLASEQIFEKNVKILDALPIHCLFRSLDQHQLIHNILPMK